MCVIPPHVTVNDFVRRVKGRSSRKIQQEFEYLRKRYWGLRIRAVNSIPQSAILIRRKGKVSDCTVRQTECSGIAALRPRINQWAPA